jgi:hypothetical protein
VDTSHIKRSCNEVSHAGDSGTPICIVTLKHNVYRINLQTLAKTTRQHANLPGMDVQAKISWFSNVCFQGDLGAHQNTTSCLHTLWVAVARGLSLE